MDDLTKRLVDALALQFVQHHLSDKTAQELREVKEMVKILQQKCADGEAENRSLRKDLDRQHSSLSDLERTYSNRLSGVETSLNGMDEKLRAASHRLTGLEGVDLKDHVTLRHMSDHVDGKLGKLHTELLDRVQRDIDGVRKEASKLSAAQVDKLQEEIKASTKFSEQAANDLILQLKREKDTWQKTSDEVNHDMVALNQQARELEKETKQKTSQIEAQVAGLEKRRQQDDDRFAELRLKAAETYSAIENYSAVFDERCSGLEMASNAAAAAVSRLENALDIHEDHLSSPEADRRPGASDAEQAATRPSQTINRRDRRSICQQNGPSQSAETSGLALGDGRAEDASLVNVKPLESSKTVTFTESTKGGEDAALERVRKGKHETKPKTAGGGVSRISKRQTPTAPKWRPPPDCETEHQGQDLSAARDCINASPIRSTIVYSPATAGVTARRRAPSTAKKRPAPTDDPLDRKHSGPERSHKRQKALSLPPRPPPQPPPPPSLAPVSNSSGAPPPPPPPTHFFCSIIERFEELYRHHKPSREARFVRQFIDHVRDPAKVAAEFGQRIVDQLEADWPGLIHRTPPDDERRGKETVLVGRAVTWRHARRSLRKLALPEIEVWELAGGGGERERGGG